MDPLTWILATLFWGAKAIYDYPRGVEVKNVKVYAAGACKREKKKITCEEKRAEKELNPRL